MADLAEVLTRLFARVADLERRLENMGRNGTVAEVNTEKGECRMKIGGTDEKPFLSPWVPYAQVAGALKIHAPPSVGQQMTLFSPSGDFRQGMAIPQTWSDGNPSPSTQADRNKVTFGQVSVEMMADELKISVGGTVVTHRDDYWRVRKGDVRFVLTDELTKMRVDDRWLIVTKTDIRWSEPAQVLPDPRPDL